MADVETIKDMDTTVKLGEELIAASHKFAIDLYKALSEENTGNLFFSPLSIQLALVLTSLGARGKTEEELLSSLQLSKDKSKWLEDIKSLMELLTQHDSLKVATELFIEKTYKLRNDYVETAKAYLKSQSQLLDFISASDSSRIHINNWVLEKTNKKIDNLLQPGTITEKTRLVLVNAIHFKNAWKHEFKTSNTTNRPFYLSKDNSITVRMMFIKENFPYIERDTFQALELPYKGDEFSMLILLPKEIDGLEGLEKQLPDMDLAQLRRDMYTEKVEVSFPKFKLEQCFDLNDVLRKLGVVSMFDEKDADLSGMYEKGELPLVVSKVVHKSFLDVNEEGTEAAAATVMMLQCHSARYPPPKRIVFNADHSFILFILKNDVILFMSKVTSIV